MKRLATLIFSVALTLGSATALATPSVWQRAREPKVARDDALLRRVERRLGQLELLGSVSSAIDPELVRELKLGVATMAELDGGASVDPRLDYLLGGALVDVDAGREAEARGLLERALARAPESPLAATGLFQLSIAAAKLGDHVTERAACVRALELTWDDDVRANLYVNLAETDMFDGDLPRAIREYHSALSASGRPDAVAMAYFGLSVALDRSGDLPSALDAATQALAIRLPPGLFLAPSALDLPGVFYTPAYEIHYYKALAAMAVARSAKSDIARRDALADAAEQWASYLVAAEPDHARWIEPARLHQASVERELSALNRRPKKASK